MPFKIKTKQHTKVLELNNRELQKILKNYGYSNKVVKAIADWYK